MPNPWKKANIAGVSRFITGIRSKRTGSSLVVQTGFPTSLADLVVKNKGRLKKPSWKKKNPSRPSDPDPDPDPDSIPAVQSMPEAVAPMPPAITVGRIIPVRRTVESPVGTRNRGYRLGLGFLAAKLFVLVALAFGRKKFVAAVTVSAFALLIIEFLGFRLFESLRPCPDRRRLNSGVLGLNCGGRGCVSPIREIEVGSQSESSISDHQACEVSSESSDLCAKTSGDDREKVHFGNSKAKRKWRMFVPKKFRKVTVGKDEEGLDNDSGSSDIKECDCNEEEGVTSKEQEEEEEDQSDNHSLSFRDSDQDLCFVAEDDHLFRENVGASRFWNSRRWVFLVVVLLGLMGGKVVALVVSLAWYLLSNSIESLWNKGKVHRVS